MLEDYVSADLRDRWPLSLPPGAVVIHLAGLAAVGPSFADPQRYITSNSQMVTNLCEWLIERDRRDVRVLGVSTGAVYQATADGSSQSEIGAVSFSSPYVVSKVLVESQLAYYRRRGLDTLVARPFNHIGPGQGSGFVVPDLTAALDALEPGAALKVGDLDTRRDYTDVRDVVSAYLLLALHPATQGHTYNVASGRSRSGREILAMICATLEREVPELEPDLSRFRATDPREVTGDAGALRAEFGWSPSIPLEQSIHDFISAWHR